MTGAFVLDLTVHPVLKYCAIGYKSMSQTGAWIERELIIQVFTWDQRLKEKC